MAIPSSILPISIRMLPRARRHLSCNGEMNLASSATEIGLLGVYMNPAVRKL